MNDGLSDWPHLIGELIQAFAAVAFVLYAIKKTVAANRARPRLQEGDILYQEWFASGCSEANWLTRVGGGSRCVRLIVARNQLIVTSWFPFTLFSAVCDMEHVVALRSLEVEAVRKTLFGTFVVLTFRDKANNRCRLRLMPKYATRFLEAIAVPAKAPV